MVLHRVANFDLVAFLVSMITPVKTFFDVLRTVTSARITRKLHETTTTCFAAILSSGLDFNSITIYSLLGLRE